MPNCGKKDVATRAGQQQRHMEDDGTPDNSLDVVLSSQQEAASIKSIRLSQKWVASIQQGGKAEVGGSPWEATTEPDMKDLELVVARAPSSLLAQKLDDSKWIVGDKPPENFASVHKDIFRSSYPKPENFGYLKKLGLKTILTLVPEPYPETHVAFMKENGIQHFQIGLPGNKEPFVNIPKTRVTDALKVVLDPANHPILIHCNKGKHRTGCVVGCMRKLMGWSMAITFDEYRRYSFPKSRALDQQFIEMWPEDPEIVTIVKNSDWLFPKYDWEDDTSIPTDGELSSSEGSSEDGSYTDSSSLL